MSIDSEFRRGYDDAHAGRDRAEPRRNGALGTFLDGLFGSRSEDEVRDAYEKGYREGLRERADEKQIVNA